MSFAKRDEYSYWYNETPITDLHEALYFLAREGSSRDPYCLAKPGGYWGQKEVPDRWELHAPWYREGSSGGDTSGTDYYQIDPALAEQLINEGYVAPRRVKQWGHTEERKDELVITEKGRCVDEAFEKQMLKKAESMLVPGIHTDLTGNPERRQYDRDKFRHGRFYVEFDTPNEGRCRIYPEQDEMIFPYPPEKR